MTDQEPLPGIGPDSRERGLAAADEQAERDRAIAEMVASRDAAMEARTASEPVTELPDAQTRAAGDTAPRVVEVDPTPVERPLPAGLVAARETLAARQAAREQAEAAASEAQRQADLARGVIGPDGRAVIGSRAKQPTPPEGPEA